MLADAHLVIAATEDESLNQLVLKLLRNSVFLSMWWIVQNVCSFIIPSIIDRSPMMIAISTAGDSPSWRDCLERDWKH